MSQMCMTRHDPPSSYGDCVRACVATLLGLDTRDVEHFTRDGCNGDTMIQRMREWLAPCGLVPFIVSLDATETPTHESVLQVMQTENPDVPYILLTAGHAVVCRNGTVEHDPAWVRTPLEAPSDAWHIVVMVRL